MILTEETHDLNGKNIVLRSARPEDAEQLITYLKTVTGETEFLECEPDEITLTKESETEFINDHTGADGKLIMLAFVDGEHAATARSMRSEDREDISTAYLWGSRFMRSSLAWD